MELIDTHCHLGFEQLANDVEAIVARSIEAGVIGWITVGTDTQQNPKAVELADKFENMYAAVGIHPHDAKDVNSRTLTELTELHKARRSSLSARRVWIFITISPSNRYREEFSRHSLKSLPN